MLETQEFITLSDKIAGYRSEITLMQWVAGVVITTGITYCVLRLLLNLLDRFYQKTGSRKPEMVRILYEAFRKPFRTAVWLCCLLEALLLIFVYIDLNPGKIFALKGIMLVVTWTVARGFYRASDLCGLLLQSARNRLDPVSSSTMKSFFEKIYKIIVIILALITALEQLGFSITGVVTGAGIAGIAVSLAAQSTLTNLFAGISLVLEHPFGIGDYIISDGHEGIVENISFRSTILRDLDNQLITIANSQLCGSVIQNLNRRDSRLWTFDIGILYGTDEDSIRRLQGKLTEFFKSDEEVVKDSVLVTLGAFADSSIQINCRMLLTATGLQEFLNAKSRLNYGIYRLVNQCGCDFAFPTETVFLESKKE